MKECHLCNATGSLTEAQWPFYVCTSRDYCIANLSKRLKTIESLLLKRL